MALSAPRAWLIAYDISDPKRLNRVHRFVIKHCVPVQYSLYYFEGSTRAVEGLLKEMQNLIKPEADDVRAYPLPPTPDIVTLGRGSLPATIQLLSSIQTDLPQLLQAQTD